MKHISKFGLAVLLLLAIGISGCAKAAAPAAGAAAPAGAEAAMGDEGGGGNESSGPTLTNPGNLPPVPETGQGSESQSGEERMVKAIDPAGQFSILFVETWSQETDSSTGAVRSASTDWIAAVETVSAQGQTPLQAAQSVDASQAGGAPGYELLAIKEGDVHGLPAASVIYAYDTGQNPVTQKALRSITSEVFVGGGPADQLGHITFSAPYAPYGDVSGIFDNILAGFNWVQGG
jgi:hypothetical protein